MHIRDLKLLTRLGCTAEERSVPQEVRTHVELRFASAPKGAVSDDLEDTICYARISAALRQHVQDREFNLVERMAGEFYGIVKKIVEGRAEIAVTVHKVRPPVIDLLGGVEFRIQDFT